MARRWKCRSRTSPRVSRRAKSRVLRKAIPPEFAERVEQLAAREQLSAIISRQYVALADSFAGGIDMVQLVGKLSEGLGPGAIMGAIPFEGFEEALDGEMRKWYEEGMRAGSEIGLRFSALAVAPELITEAASDFIRSRALERSRLIVGESRRAYHYGLDRLLRARISPTQAAEQLGQIAGLYPRQALSLVNYELELRRQLIPVGEEATRNIETVIRRRVKARRQKLLRYRGRLIAETEMQFAINYGEREYWEAADRQGQVNRELITMRWKTVLPSSGVCSICKPLHNVVVGFDGSFKTKAEILKHPPAHPLCRCWIEYKVKEAE